MKKTHLVTVFGLVVLGAGLAGCGGTDLTATVTPDESGAVESPSDEAPANDETGETPPPESDNPVPGTLAPNEDAPNFGDGIKGGRGLPAPQNFGDDAPGFGDGVKGGRGLDVPPAVDPTPEPFVVHGVNFEFIPHGQTGTDLPPVDRSCTTAEKTKFCGSESRTASCRGDETVDDNGNVTNTSFSYTCVE